MFCAYCGNPNTDGAGFCSACGKPLQTPQSSCPSQPNAQQQADSAKPLIDFLSLPSYLDPKPKPNAQQTCYDSNMPISVPNYLVYSILVTVFCCIPFGVVAIYSSNQVNTKLAVGDIQGAMTSSQNARKYCIISFVIGIVMFFFSVLRLILTVNDTL